MAIFYADPSEAACSPHGVSLPLPLVSAGGVRGGQRSMDPRVVVVEVSPSSTAGVQVPLSKAAQKGRRSGNRLSLEEAHSVLGSPTMALDSALLVDTPRSYNPFSLLDRFR